MTAPRLFDPDPCAEAGIDLRAGAPEATDATDATDATGIEGTRSAEPESQADSEPEALPVRLVRSKKRRKTIQGRLVEGVVEVRIPSGATEEQEAKWVADMVGRFERQRVSGRVDLTERAELLAERYDLPVPSSVRWVSNQNHRWGSCSVGDRSIRLSDRMAGFPTWVVDSVLVHELAHLVHANHSPEFWELVERYPKLERANGYLIAKSEDDVRA